MAAGKGTRMRSGLNKIFLKINELPIVLRTLLAFQRVEVVDDIILVCRGEERKKLNDLIANCGGISKLLEVVDGGVERADSVMNGLAYYQAESREGIIMIHDAARPFCNQSLIHRILEKTSVESIVIPALGMNDTIRKIEGKTTITLPRHRIFAVQTPQAFFSSKIDECFLQYRKSDRKFTDEASYFEYAGFGVEMVDGEIWNIKITSPEDINWASCLLTHYPELEVTSHQ